MHHNPIVRGCAGRIGACVLRKLAQTDMELALELSDADGHETPRGAAGVRAGNDERVLQAAA